MRPLEKFRPYYIVLYVIISYHFFVSLSYKPAFDNSSLTTVETKIFYDISSPSVSLLGKKILLDLKSKEKMGLYLPKIQHGILLDHEGKIFGHKDQENLFYNPNRTIRLNKKLLNSTLFGSIKLIVL
jgi:hypothetical protein